MMTAKYLADGERERERGGPLFFVFLEIIPCAKLIPLLRELREIFD